MPIPEYIRPQLEVYQQLDATVAATGDHLAACIVGANYDLYRYGYEDLEPHAFKSSGDTIQYKYDINPALDYKVDTASVTVFAEGLQAKLGELTTGLSVDSANPFVLRSTADLTNKATFNNTGYLPKVGDFAEVTYTGGTTKNLVITDLLGKEIPASAEVSTTSELQLTVANEAAYSGTKATTIIVTVQAVDSTHITALVMDSMGLMAARTITFTSGSSISLGLGLEVTPTWGIVDVDDVVSIECNPKTASTTEFTGLVFNNLPVPYGSNASISKVTFLKEYTGVIDPAVATSGASANAIPVVIRETGIEYPRNLGMYLDFDTAGLTFCEFINDTGYLYVEYRVQVIPMADEDIFDIYSESDIETNFGTIAIENELAYGCYMALKGSQGRHIYAIRVRSTDADGFLEGVRKTESNSSTYNFGVITDDVEVMEAVADFGNEMSAPDVKKWRVTRVGVDFPGEYDLTSAANDATPLRATLTINQTIDGHTGTLLTTTSDIDFLALGVNGRETALHYGDKVRVNSTGAVYVIKRILGAQALLLETGPTTSTGEVSITLIKADTAANEAEYVTNLAKNFADRRVTVIWTDQAKNNNDKGALVVIPNKFLACEVAGLASAVLPQKSLTHTEVTGITQASRMYTKYTQKQLDNIAKEGVMVITQDAKATACYVRHQLTTDVNHGSLYYEDSCTRNLDNISYHIVDEIHNFIGHANVVVPALRKLEAKLVTLLANFTQDTVDDMVGPSLVDYSDLTIIQDPVFRDRIIVKVKLYLPLPLNNIKVYEMAYTAQVTL